MLPGDSLGRAVFIRELRPHPMYCLQTAKYCASRTEQASDQEGRLRVQPAAVTIKWSTSPRVLSSTSRQPPFEKRLALALARRF
jgi:hypothetical protein